MNPISLFLFKCFTYPFGVLCSIGYLIWWLFYTLKNIGRVKWRAVNREKPPQCLVDPSWGKHGFLQLKDARIHYVEDGDRNKPLILFVHGFPEFWYSWRHQLREFSRDYWTVAIDLRGYGESDKLQKQSAYKIVNVIDDIKQFVLNLGRDKFIMVGHDWGGLITWNFLDFYPEMIEKYVVLDCPYHRSWAKLIATDLKQLMVSWYCFFFQMPCLPEFALKFDDFAKFDAIKASSPNKNITEEDLEVYKYTYSKPDALKHAINYYRANCCQLYVKKEPLEKHPPGALIFAEKDEYMKTDFLDMAKREVSHLQTCIIKDAIHFVQQDRPIEVNKAMRHFFEDKPLQLTY